MATPFQEKLLLRNQSPSELQFSYLHQLLNISFSRNQNQSLSSTLTLSSSTTSRLTPPPSSVAEPTVLTVASTRTWPPHATSRSSFRSVRSLSPVPPRAP